MTASKSSSRFPNHIGPRVWFITSSDSWLRVSIAREALAHGDFVVCGEHTSVSSTDDTGRHPDLVSLVNQAKSEGCSERLRVVRFDAKYVAVPCEASTYIQKSSV